MTNVAYKAWDWVEKNSFVKNIVEKTKMRSLGRKLIRYNQQNKTGGMAERISLKEIKKETRQYLDEIYGRDIEELEKMIGRSLAQWKK